MIDHYNSTKISKLSLFFILLVVILHAKNTNRVSLGVLNNNLNFFIQDYVSAGLCRVAVPAFFIISGFLFFHKYRSQNFGRLEYKKTIKRRIKTLVIPYLVVSCIGFLFFFILQIPNVTKGFFNNDLIVNYSFLEILDTLFINPLPYQLWFVRNLFLVCLITPLIYKIVRYNSIYIIVVSCAWLFFSKSVPFFLLETLFSFSLGAFLGLKRNAYLYQTLSNRSRILNLFLLCCWLLLSACSLCLSHYYILSTLFLNLSILTGILFLWRIYDYIDIQNYWWNKMIGFSFFIYLFHEPMLTILIKISFFYLGKNDFASMIAYIITPILSVLGCLILGSIMKKYIPHFYNLVIGGR